jgi:serine/threonine protein phosphatase PrpC
MWKRLPKTIRQMARTTPQSLERRMDKNGAYSEVTQRRRTLAPAVNLCAITDVGRVREENEDTFFLSEDGRVLIVADGMGGHQSGEVASALAVETVAEFLLSEQPETTDAGHEQLERLLRSAFDAAQQKVIEASQNCIPGPGMGATLIAACVLGDVLHTCHVGDVRCYLRTKSSFEQVTRDHSIVGVESGLGGVDASAGDAVGRPRKPGRRVGQHHGCAVSACGSKC